MEQNKKISIISPVYDNGKEYKGLNWLPILNECLKHQIEQNFEWIIVYDGKSQKCEEQVKDYINVRYFEMGKRYGNWGNFSRDFGLKQAEGEYVVFLDQDNIIFENYLSDLSKILDSNSEIGFSLCPIYISYTFKPKILLPAIERGRLNTLCFMLRKEVISIKGWWSRNKGKGDEVAILKDLINKKIKFLMCDRALGIWNGIRYKYPEEIYPFFIDYFAIEKIAGKDDKATRSDKELWFSV